MNYPDFVRLFLTSAPLRSVELRMKKESRDLVASTGHLCMTGVIKTTGRTGMTRDDKDDWVDWDH